MPQNRESKENGNVDSEEGTNNPKDRQRREKLDLGSAVSEIMKLQADPGRRERELEHLTGGVRNRQVDLALAKHMHPCYEKWDSGNVTHPSKSRSLELQFLDEPSDPVLTGKKIEGKERTSVRIALVDGLTGQVVNSGHEASLNVEIVVLESDFNGYEGDNWSVEEFDSKIVQKIEGRKSPLSGDVSLNLMEGIGFLGNVYFTHTKCWMKRHKFRLGARIVGGSNGVRVREAKTEPFVVKDRRGNLYGKHHPPSLSDAVWRLEVIGKDGAFHRRLSNENINTVKDFLTQLNINPLRLKQILGVSMSATMWDINVEHARTCKIDQKAYLYYSPISQQVTAVIFNVVGQLMGLLMGQHFVSADTLSETEKADAQKLVVLAFEHWGEVVAVDDATSLMAGSQQLANAPNPSNLITVESPKTVHLHADIQQNTTSTEIISLGGTITLEHFGFPCFQKLDCLSEQGQIPNSGIYDPESSREDVNDENPNFLNFSSVLPNVLYPSNSTINESSCDTQILTSHNILGSYDPELVPSSGDIVPSIDSIWDVNFLGDYDLQRIDNTSHRYEETLTFMSPDTNSMIYETESTFEAICEFEQLQISENLSSVQSQDSNWKLQGDPYNAVNDILLAGSSAVTVNKSQRRQLSKSNAQRRWRTLFSIMRWFSVRRDVARKTLLVEIREDPNASSQANLQSAVNDILSARFAAVSIKKAQKRYLSNRGEVQRRWRMLFSVMRWFSVKRKVARKTTFRETAKSLSASFGDIKPPICSITGTNSLNNEQPLSFPAYITKTPICVAGSMTLPICEDTYMQLLDAYFSNPQSGVNDTTLARSAAVGLNKTPRRYLLKRNKARGRWRMLFSIVRWFSVRRNVARK